LRLGSIEINKEKMALLNLFKIGKIRIKIDRGEIVPASVIRIRRPIPITIKIGQGGDGYHY